MRHSAQDTLTHVRERAARVGGETRRADARGPRRRAAAARIPPLGPKATLASSSGRWRPSRAGAEGGRAIALSEPSEVKVW